MNVLIVTTSYPRKSNDMSGIFIKRLATAMCQSGSNVTVLAPGDINSNPEEVDEGIHIIRFNYAPKSWMKIAYGVGGIPENLKHNLSLYLILPFFLTSLIFNILRFSKHCDIIHANWFFTGLCALPAAKIKKKKIAVTLRGSDFKKKRSRLMIWLSRHIDLITTVNEKWAEDLKKIVSCKVFYTPNGVGIFGEKNQKDQRYNKIKGIIRVGWVGSLSITKGADILEKIARITLTKNPQIQFLVAGPGFPEKFNLHNLPNVTFLGSIPPDEVFHVYSAIDIFILPSRHEGRPNSLLEAMSTGLPCVATNLPGVREILTEECGIIIDIENPLKMAEAIFELAENPEKRKQMGENSKKKIQQLSLSWNDSASNYLKIFKGIILCAE